MEDTVLDGKTETERVVSAIWEHELGQTVVLPENDFFELGGDSLHVLNMLLRVQSQLGIELSPGVLFECPTLRDFCQRLEGTKSPAQSVHSMECLEGIV